MLWYLKVAMIPALTGLVYGQGRRGLKVHLGGPPKFGNRAPGRVPSQPRPNGPNGSAIAQNHQGPPKLGCPTGLGTTAAMGCHRGSSIFR